MMRQICKQILTIAAWLALALGAFAEGTAPDIVTDPLTGVAIEGYDPVTYFILPEPEQGKPDFEYVWGGVSWYFTSAANRDVFAHSPEVYAPQFGGHCATSLSRGYLSDGKPRLFAVEGLKLYLFYSTANRDAFMLSKGATIAKAEANWAALDSAAPAPSAPVAPGGAVDNVQSH